MGSVGEESQGPGIQGHSGGTAATRAADLQLRSHAEGNQPGDEAGTIMNWLLNAMRGRRMERAVAEDIENHLAEKTAELIEAGMPERQARLQARRVLGNAALLIEASREVWGWMWLERLVQDLRLSTRLMARNPGFTAVASLSFALGIGANTAIFGLLDRIAWRMLPVHNP